MEMKEYLIETNGINLNILEMGEGPLVLMVHGHPELAYSYRHQIPAIAAAGYRVVAPDQRGYGKSDIPPNIEDYDIFQLVGDIVGLVHALGEEQAVIMGHDWGAMVAWNSALLRPDMFTAVALMSVPYNPRTWSTTSPMEFMNMARGENNYYISSYQEPGVVEKEMESDVRSMVKGFLYSASGSAPLEERWRPFYGPKETMRDTITIPETLPDWLTEEDVDVFTAAFERTGFGPGVNWYRNFDRNWALTPWLSQVNLRQPTVYIAGDQDVVIQMMAGQYKNMEKTVPNLTKKVLIPGIGHWVQQEAPEEVNTLLLEFLAGL
jgi:pimeloyl-ACP methyl ester carboxylesterase